MASTYARNVAAVKSGAHKVCAGGCVPRGTCTACGGAYGVCAGCGWCYQCTTYTAPANPAAVWGAPTPAPKAPKPTGAYTWRRNGNLLQLCQGGTPVATAWQHAPGVWACAAGGNGRRPRMGYGLTRHAALANAMGNKGTKYPA